MDAQVAPLKCIFNEGRCDSDFDCTIRCGSGAQCMPVNGTTQFKISNAAALITYPLLVLVMTN